MTAQEKTNHGEGARVQVTTHQSTKGLQKIAMMLVVFQMKNSGNLQVAENGKLVRGMAESTCSNATSTHGK